MAASPLLLLLPLASLLSWLAALASCPCSWLLPPASWLRVLGLPCRAEQPRRSDTDILELVALKHGKLDIELLTVFFLKLFPSLITNNNHHWVDTTHVPDVQKKTLRSYLFTHNFDQSRYFALCEECGPVIGVSLHRSHG